MTLTITIAWPAAAAICSICGALTWALAWYIRAIVREELKAQAAELVSKEVYNLHVAEADRRFEALERRHAA